MDIVDKFFYVDDPLFGFEVLVVGRALSSYSAQGYSRGAGRGDADSGDG